LGLRVSDCIFWGGERKGGSRVGELYSVYSGIMGGMDMGYEKGGNAHEGGVLYERLRPWRSFLKGLFLNFFF
jgi:hypothetical protein